MGKYMRKPKLSPEVSVMDIGVRTRSKTLALNSLSFSPPNCSRPGSAASAQLDSFLQDQRGFQPIQRAIRESTPCDLVRDVDDISASGSSTRNPGLTAENQRPRSSNLTNVPSTREMDELFAHLEQQQQRFFMEKYNFDIINDTPLPGRYEWVEVNL